MDSRRTIWVVVKIRALFWGTLNIRCRIIIGTQTGTKILTNTHICMFTVKLIVSICVPASLSQTLKAMLWRSWNNREEAVNMGASISSSTFSRAPYSNYGVIYPKPYSNCKGLCSRV